MGFFGKVVAEPGKRLVAGAGIGGSHPRIFVVVAGSRAGNEIIIAEGG